MHEKPPLWEVPTTKTTVCQGIQAHMHGDARLKGLFLLIRESTLNRIRDPGII